MLEPPEGLVGFSKRLFSRDADILQEVEVVALRNFAQRAALAGRANHRPTVERVPAMNPLSCAFERDRALGATSQKDSQWAIKVDMAGLRCWCRAAAPGQTERDQ